MSTPADQTINTLRANHDELAAHVRQFQDDDLDRQSGASEWDIAQVLSHLGSGAEIQSATLRSAVSGSDAPGDDFNQSVWDRWNAMSQREKADGFLHASEELMTAFAELGDKDRSETQVQLSFLPFPIDINVFAGMRVSEAAMHSWDVRVASDPQAALTADEAAIILDNFTGALSFFIGFLAKSEALGGAEATLRVETTDPQRSIGLTLGPSVSLGDAPADPDGVLELPAEAFVRLLSGRLAPDHTPDSVRLEGSAVTLDQLRAVFPGF